MKRGEIFEFGEKGSMGVATGGKQNGGLAFMWIRGWPEHKGVDSNPKDPTPYTGPTYEKDGRRFVPSGEYREPLQDEWYLSGPIGEPTRAVLVPLPHYPTLLPIPELEPEHEFKGGDWVRYKETGKIYQVSNANAFAYSMEKTCNRYEKLLGICPEFKVGEFVRCVGSHHKGEIFRVDSLSVDGWVRSESMPGTIFNPKNLEKLPGRPLTTDDLMLNAGGKEIIVHCNGCECNGAVEIIYPVATSDGVAFFHKGNGAPVATFSSGAIVFAPDVEGNIYVVEA